MTVRKLIVGGTLLTMDPAVPDGLGDVLIEDGLIAAVGRGLVRGGVEVIEAAGSIVMPGLVNAHLHTWQTPLRGIGGDWAGRDYDDVLHARLAPQYRPEDLYTATLFGALCQLDGGVTTLFDWCHNNPTPAHSDAAVDALLASGVRAVFGHGSAKPEPQPGERHFSTVPHDWAEVRRLRRWLTDNGLVTLAACLLGPDYADLEVCREDFRQAREFGLLSSAHVWGLPGRVVPGGYAALAAEGLIPPGHNVVHGNYLADEELDCLLEHGATVTSAPTVELRSHARRPASVRLRQRGHMPSIGVDCEALAGDRMLDALRFTLQVHRLFSNMAEGAPPAVTPLRTVEVLRWGTMGNAAALGMGDRIGSLTPGKQADILVVRRTGPHVAPAADPAQVMVQYAETSDIDTVLVAGRMVKQGGRLLHQGFAAAQAATEELAARLFAGLDPALRARCALGELACRR